MQRELDIPLSCECRVHLHGLMEVWKRTAEGHWVLVEKEAWGTGRATRTVLQRLLVAPGRRLSRGIIQDDLWPEIENGELAERTLYNAINQIRRAIGKSFVTTFESSYRLAAQTLIWVDLDACEVWLREAENLGRSSLQAIPLLEQTLALLERGEVCEGESGIWVYGVRTKSEEMLRQCRLWLAEAYSAQGKLWHAGELYRAILLADSSEEEALRQWLEMLAHHGKQREALKRYQNMKATWEAQGFVPSQMKEWVPASLEQEEDVNRREATQKIGTFVGGLLLTAHQPLSLLQKNDLLHREELLSIYATTIPILWRLYFDGHFTEVQHVLFPEYLPQLLLMVQNTIFQKRAASLLSQASQLAALIEKHQSNFGNALLHAQQGEQYGQLADDPNLQIAALIQQANIYADLGQAWRELQAYQQAYRFSQQAKPKSAISALLLGRVYVGLAKSSGKCSDHEQQALRFLEMAQHIYPEHPEKDEAFGYSYHSRFTLLNHTGLTYLNIGQPQQALHTFTSMPVPTELAPRTLEFLIRMSMTSFALGDLEQTCEHISLAATSAKTLGSDLRYNEAYSIYEQARATWPKEAHIHTLAEHFR